MKTIIILAVVGLLVLFFIAQYNRLVRLNITVDEAWAQIEVQLKRRADLIPNLVEAVKGYMAHEKGTLNEVIEARNRAMSAGQQVSANPGDPNAMQKLNQAEGQLGGAMSRLFALSEAYPDLKANTNMLQLQEELTSTENKVSFARQAFNDAVTAYNTKREVFPNVIFAGMFGFFPAELFQVESEAVKEAPKIKF